jgi:sulfite exporter TauE/SafE
MAVIVGSCLAGLWLGATHSLEPDHLAALSTLVSRERTPGQAARLGLAWGLGHASSLVLVFAALGALPVELPEEASASAELVVAAMLILLGLRGLGRVFRRRGWQAPLVADAPPGITPHSATRDARPSLAIGLVHGLAGGGGLAALAAAAMPTWEMGLLFVALFGAGSIVSMALVGWLARLTLNRVDRQRQVHVHVQVAAGVTSLLVGVAWVCPAAAELLA